MHNSYQNLLKVTPQVWRRVKRSLRANHRLKNKEGAKTAYHTEIGSNYNLSYDSVEK